VRSSAAARATEQGMKSIKMSELGETEVCIDGVVYDLAEFDHPGGDVVKVFGGNDVTTQYRMIHHSHDLNPTHFLSQMKKVGYVTDYSSEYMWGSEFEKEVKREVFKIVGRGNEWGTRGFWTRVVLYVSFMAAIQCAWVYYGSSVALALLLGVAQAFIGLNVQHDANHGAASRNPVINAILGYGADMIGGSKYLWIEQHWTHHTFTNNPEKDGDALSAEPLMLFNDYPLGDPRRKWFHKFQAIFFLPVLSFYWVSSVFNPQVIDLNHRGTMETMNWGNSYVASKRPVTIALRLLYILMNVVSPFVHHSAAPLTALFHIWLMSVTESLMLSVLFSLSHNFEHVDRDPTKLYKETGKKVCWFKAQVETSSTYGGFIAGCLTGGLNHQVEHHLFPRMSSAWYPYIAPKVREICKKHGVQYIYYPWIWQNLWATVKYMHASGNGTHWEMNPLSGNA